MTPVSEFAAKDIPQLRSFVLEAWQLAGSSALGWTGANDGNIQEIASESFLQGFVENPNLKVFINKTGEKVIGFCVIRKMDDQLLELAGIIVRQDQLGIGFGTELFNVAKKEAVTSGFTVMIVKTESTNDRALSFYKSKEFVEDGQVIEEIGETKVNLTVLKLKLRKK